MSSPFSSAQWIASPHRGGPCTPVPLPYFRQTFRISSPIQKATLRITALGVYEAEINGHRVGDHVLSPGWTDYGKRVAFQTYDVTPLVKDGANALGVILGDGWYSGFLAWDPRQHYGKRPQLLALLTIASADGKVTEVPTDGSWKTETGPILLSDMLRGESYDATLERDGWSTAGGKDDAWHPVEIASDPGIAIVTSAAPPVRRIEEIPPVAGRKMEPWLGGGIRFDFGQNFSGRLRLSVEAKRGTTLTIRHAEMLNPDGTLHSENLRTATAVDHYTCRGDGRETWEPRFTFHGFRYAQISGLTDADALEVTGIVLHSDMSAIGSFSCSNPLLNQLQSNIIWGQKSNFLEIPTDCPQRDERLGWTGDAQVFARTACFNMDVSGFFKKWMQDIRDAQKSNGAVPPVAPDVAVNIEDGGPAWADATIICPWTVYLCYGDTDILAGHYDSMERYMDFLAAHRCKDHIRGHPEVDPWGGFGDWLSLDGAPKVEGTTPKDLIGTAFYANNADLLARIAKTLGRKKDAQKYRTLHVEIVEAFQRRFVTAEGLLTSGTQTAYSIALHFGLLPEGHRAAAGRALVRDIEKREFHLATGFVGTPYILDALEATGHLDVAYKLLEQESFPSWLFPIKNGATTIWERWDGWTPEKGFQDKSMNSFNHYAYGAVGAWMYRTVAGLDTDPSAPGYARIVFRPRPGGSLTHAEARLKTPRGETGIRWSLEDNLLSLELTVPEGAEATLSPPPEYSAAITKFGPGLHLLRLTKTGTP